MALKGNLTDLPIGNIFQMIFLEKKGGKLTVRSGDNQVEIFFENGKILHTEQGKEIDSYRLKRVLVANKYIEDTQWGEVLKKNRETLKPVWVIVAELMEMNTYHYIIQRQVEHVLFSLLQWKQGEYEFDADCPIYLDRKLFKPMDGEFLLMQVYSVIDEWSEMSSSLPANNTLLAKNTDNVTSGYQLTENEEHVLSIINTPVTFGDILQSSQVSISETAKIVKELLDTTILVEEEPFLKEEKGKRRFWGPGLLANIAPVAAMAALLLSALFVRNFTDPSNATTLTEWKNRAAFLKAKRNLLSVHKAIIYYFSLYEKMPVSTYTLVEKGFLNREELLDPWGRNIVFQVKEDTYSIFSQGPNSDDPADNIPAPPAKFGQKQTPEKTSPKNI